MTSKLAIIHSYLQSSMKGIGRKSGEDAPKWISFGKRDNNADAVKNTRNFKANDVLKVFHSMLSPLCAWYLDISKHSVG